MTNRADDPSPTSSGDASSFQDQLADQIPDPQAQVAVDLRRALAGGVIAAIIAFLSSYMSGQVTGMRGLAMLETMLPTTRFLCSAVMTASATILALMLTILSLSLGGQYELQSVHYQRVRQIAWLDSIAFICATVFLLFLNVPVGGGENVPTSWFSGIYYAVLILSSLLGGLLIAVVLMLYNTLTKLIEVIDPEVEGAHLRRGQSGDQ